MSVGVRRVLRTLLGTRGATTVEYAIILVAVLLLGAGSFKLLGGTLGKKTGGAGNTISSNDDGSGGGGKKAAAAPAGNAKAAGGGDNAATSKVKVGGVGGGGETANPDNAGRNRDTSSESGPAAVGGISNVTDKGGTDVADGFGAKRWFGIGLLAVGVLALGYVAMSMVRAKKGGDAVAGDGKSGGGKRKPA